MFALPEIEAKLIESKKVLSWVINGLGIHGFKIRDAHKLEWWWITKNYNVNDFKCKHVKVSEYNVVYTKHGREYDGYCDACKRHVHGFKSNKK